MSDFQMNRASLLSIVITIPILTSCAYEPPSNLNAPQIDNIMALTQKSMLKKIEASSFSSSKALYPTAMELGHHTVPLGDYIVARLVQEMPEQKKLIMLRMKEQQIICHTEGFMAPHAVCSGKLTVEADTSNLSHIISTQVPNTDVGNQSIAFGQLLGAPAGGDRTIRLQVTQIADKLVDQIIQLINQKIY